MDDTDAPADLPLLRSVATRVRRVVKGTEILRQGAVPRYAHVLLSGHTCRQRTLPSGRRQITAILVPGDMCDVEAVLRGHAEYGAVALTDCTLGEIPRAIVKGAQTDHPALFTALVERVRRDEAIAREWLVTVGRRNTTERIAHLLCELRTRFATVGLASDDQFELPLSQYDLADALGVTSVHISRQLRELRLKGLITLSGRQVILHDRAGLEQLAEFDPGYLESRPHSLAT